MPIFLYKAKDKKGLEAKGLVEAQNKKQALTILREKGYFCYSLKEKGESLLLSLPKKIFNKASSHRTGCKTRMRW